MKNIDKAIRMAEAATPGPWEWWTSNSWRRLTPRNGQDGGVLCPVVSRADGHPDCSIKQVDMAHISQFDPPAVLALLRFVQAWDALEAEESGFGALAASKQLDTARAAVDEALR